MGKRNRERVARIRAGLETPRVMPAAERAKLRQESGESAVAAIMSQRKPLTNEGPKEEK